MQLELNIYLATIEASLKEKPKIFWKYHQARLNFCSALNPVITLKNHIAKSPREKTELFITYFCSVFHPTKTTVNPEVIHLFVADLYPIVRYNHLRRRCCAASINLGSSKATGHDGIPGWVLKECSSVIAPSLCSLFNHSLHSGTVSNEWKSANVTPVHKKDKKEPAANY